MDRCTSKKKVFTFKLMFTCASFVRHFCIQNIMTEFTIAMNEKKNVLKLKKEKRKMFMNEIK